MIGVVVMVVCIVALSWAVYCDRRDDPKYWSEEEWRKRERSLVLRRLKLDRAPGRRKGK